MGIRLGDNNPHSQLFLYIGWFNALPVHRGLQCNRRKRGRECAAFVHLYLDSFA